MAYGKLSVISATKNFRTLPGFTAQIENAYLIGHQTESFAYIGILQA